MIQEMEVIVKVKADKLVHFDNKNWMSGLWYYYF